MKKLLFILISAFVLSCQQGGGPISQADKDAISKNIEVFAAAFNGNLSDLDGVYADDIVSLPPHEAEISGKSNVIGFHSDPNGPKTTAFKITPSDIDGSGNIAYARGTWSYSGVMNDTINIDDNGKFLLVLKKQANNSWKTSREIWNSNLPMPGN